MITNQCDHSLMIAIELVTDEQTLSRPLFPDLLREPMLFRLIRKWIISGLATRSKIEDVLEGGGLNKVE